MAAVAFHGLADAASAQSSPPASVITVVTADLNQHLDGIRLDCAASALRSSFGDLIANDIESLLAGKAGISVEELRRSIAASAEGPDPLDRARAAVLQGNFASALKVTAPLKRKDAPSTVLVAVLTVEAQASEGTGDLKAALAARRQIAGFFDKEKDPAGWVAAQHMVACAYESLERHPETESTLRDILAVEQHVLPPDHPDTLVTHTRLGLALRRQNKNKESESLHRTVAETRSRILGPRHPLTLSSMSHFANVMLARGKFKDGEAGHREVLEMRENTLGAEHRDTLISRINLGNAFYCQGRLDEADREYSTVFHIRLRVLGADHPETLQSRRAVVANGHSRQGRQAEEEGEYRAILAAQKRVRGENHPDTIQTRDSLALSLRNAGKWEQAASEFKALLAIHTRVKGADHISTRMAHDQLALALERWGDESASKRNTREARRLYQEALVHREAAHLLPRAGDGLKNKLALLPAAE